MLMPCFLFIDPDISPQNCALSSLSNVMSSYHIQSIFVIEKYIRKTQIIGLHLSVVLNGLVSLENTPF